MKRKYKKDEHIGYEIGEKINIHTHISDPESWFLTIRQLEIFGQVLCSKTCHESEIARYIYLVLQKKKSVIDELIKDTSFFM